MFGRKPTPRYEAEDHLFGLANMPELRALACASRMTHSIPVPLYLRCTSLAMTKVRILAPVHFPVGLGVYVKVLRMTAY